MELFYSEQIKGNHIILPEQESKHCIKVLRHKVGDTINIINGKGVLYKAVIIDASGKTTITEIIETKENFGKPNFHLNIALGLLKNPSRYENFIEKATELGVSVITPMVSRYTEKKVFKPQRYTKILIAAAKQSLRADLPRLQELEKFENIVKQADEEQKFVALCDAQSTLLNEYKTGKSAIILIGPEGGFSEEEKQMATDNGFIPVKIGNSRLRAETAAIVTAALIANLNLQI